MSDAIAEFNAALSELQSELPAIAKDQTATVKSDKATFSYDYADLTVISERVLPLLSQHGFAFTCLPTVREDKAVVLRFALLHKGGHSERGDYPLPSQATPQQLGSAITYGRRYCLCAVTGIAPGGEDDDGKGAADTNIAHRPPAPVSDEVWLDSFDNRVTVAANETELAALDTEAQLKYRKGEITKDDAKRVKTAIDARRRELVPA